MKKSFKVIWRNPGHWDICNPTGRLFRVRGIPGKHIVIDERALDKSNLEFKTVSLCMAYICDEIMFEHLEANGKHDGNCTIKENEPC